MSSGSGSTKDMNDGRSEALHALLNSLSPEASGSQNVKQKLSSEQVRRLSDKLDEILGDKADNGDGVRRNEKGELVNEEGLPIIDITEPVSSGEDLTGPDPFNTFDDPDLLPMWALSPAERARRKAERERILDALEAEEQLERTREAEIARVRLHEEMEKRKEAQRTEMENLKRARELQKKMGRALLRSVVDNREQEEKQKAEMEKADREAAAKKASLKPKKSVTFADEPVKEDGPTSERGKGIDWGDVAPARLRAKGPTSLLTKDHMEHLPMKMHVVERHPRVRSPAPPAREEGDSDDESDAGSLVDADSEDGVIHHADCASDSEDEKDHDLPHSDSDSEDDDDDDNLPPDDEHDDWGGEDFDSARHQREVALEYYEKRKIIGAEVSSAMRAHSHNEEDEWDQPDVPLEATLSSPHPKPSISRFRADRLSGISTISSLASHSLGASVLPSAQSASLKSAVRMGKLEDDKLVGGEEGESDVDIETRDENARAMLDMLRKGEVTNIGPEAVAAEPPPPEVARTEVTEAAPMGQPKPSRVSKFKIALTTQPTIVREVSPGMDSSLSTPINNLDRSSPKMQSPRNSTPLGNGTPTASSSKLPAMGSSRQLPSMIVESPSFLPPSALRSQTTQAPASAFRSVIIESPSFQSTAGSPATSLSPTSTAVASAATSAQASPVSTTPLRASVRERRPPTVVPAAVRPADGAAEGKQKVSRFKAQRQ